MEVAPRAPLMEDLTETQTSEDIGIAVGATSALVRVDAVMTAVPVDHPADESMDARATEIPDGADGEQGGLIRKVVFFSFLRKLILKTISRFRRFGCCTGD